VIFERADQYGKGRVTLCVMDADALSTGAAARSALEALRAAAGSDSPLERHCLRQFLIAERLAGDWPFDRELLLCASWLHDLGLFAVSSEPYVTEGARLAARVLEPFAWPPERLQRCMDACEQHHAPRSRLAMGLEVELVRQSDLVDVTAGLVNFGLDRRWLRELFRKVPRDGLWRLIGSAVLNELRHRPTSLSRVFLSPRRTRPWVAPEK
jgi:HD domain